MEHDIPYGNSNRENGTTFLDFPLFLGIFQWDEPTKHVPFTAEPEIPEILTKWKALCVSRFLARDRNYDWRQRKTQLWRRHLNFRVRVFVKSAVIDLLVFFICYYCLHRLRQYHRQISTTTCEEEKKLPFYLYSFFLSSQLNNSIFCMY